MGQKDESPLLDEGLSACDPVTSSLVSIYSRYWLFFSMFVKRRMNKTSHFRLKGKRQAQPEETMGRVDATTIVEERSIIIVSTPQQ